MKPMQGRSRVVIEAITPQVDGGRYPVCRVVGDRVEVTAAVFADGHDHVAARLLYRHSSEKAWRFQPMVAQGNDLWSASFVAETLGGWSYTILGWVDHFETWTSDLRKRLAAQPPTNPVGGSTPDETAVKQDIPLALRSGAVLVEQAARRARGTDARQLRTLALSLVELAAQDLGFYVFPFSEEVEALVARYPDLSFVTRYMPELQLRVDPGQARFSAWYELFPRSTSATPGQHGTFADVERQLPEIAAMGFDVLYLPPIHPIGNAFRKGPNNSVTAMLGDHGSPWAIGNRSASGGQYEGDDGGHKSIHPQLGSFGDFRHLVEAAKEHGLAMAMDIAFQCSPDHPWVTQHPEWFTIRPDGSIQYAENPPKKYQDIYPLNFESPDWRGLWNELCSVFEFWIEHGVSIFRVDNPHTKGLPFWEWCLGKLHAEHPETIFLAEAFTRPHVMYSLAKAGFTQSYTYFTWRTTAKELRAYLEEIARPPVSDFFQPNFWPNTPDILPRELQVGGRPAFVQRLILAATLAANYGIYGPAYELCENAPAKPQPGKIDSEEYLDSEKYEIRQRDRNAAGSLVPLITLLNQIRRANPALQSNASLQFHDSENAQILCYSKATADFSNTLLVVITMDFFAEQGGWLTLDLEHLGLAEGTDFQVEDFLTGAVYAWRGARNYVALNPQIQLAHVLRIVRNERILPSS